MGVWPGACLAGGRVNFMMKKSITICSFCVCLLACLNARCAQVQTQTPSPALLVLDKEDNMLSIIDPATGKTVARIPTGEGPHEIAASDDGKLAFVANYGARTPGNTISLIDVVAQKELRRVDLGALRRHMESPSPTRGSGSRRSRTA